MVLGDLVLYNQWRLLKLTYLGSFSSDYKPRLSWHLWTPMLSELWVKLYWIELLWEMRIAGMIEWLIVFLLSAAYWPIYVSNLRVISPGVVHISLYLSLVIIVVLLEINQHQGNIVLTKVVSIALISYLLAYLLKRIFSCASQIRYHSGNLFLTVHQE